jgi:hypothetical protein
MIMQSIYDGYASKPLFQTIYSPYSNEIQEHFKLVSIAIVVQGDICHRIKYLKKI